MQCLSHLFSLHGAPRRPALSIRVAAAAQPVLQLLLQHAAAAGANVARLGGKTSHVVAAVSSRIAAAADNSCASPHARTRQTHQTPATAAAAPAAAAAGAPSISPINGGPSGGPSVALGLCSDTVEPAPAATPAAGAAAAAATDDDACSAPGPAQGPPSRGADPAGQSDGPEGDKQLPAAVAPEGATPAEGSELPTAGAAAKAAGAAAEAAYWECIAAVLEGFGGALLAVFENLVGVGAHEERQLLLRALLRLLQTPAARTATAAAAAGTVAAATAAEMKGEAPGEEDSPAWLTLLLLQLLVCSAGRLVWPLLLQRANDAALCC